MEDSLTCTEVESLLFDRRRQELTDLRKAMVDKHLRRCMACRQLATKTEEMLDAAGDDDPSLWTDFDADSLFGRIAADLHEADDAPESLDDEQRLDELFLLAREIDPTDEAKIDSRALFDDITGRLSSDEEAEESPASSSRTPWIAIAAAAACAAIAGWWLVSINDASPSADPTDEAPAQIAEVDEPASSPEVDADELSPALQYASSPQESLRLFADDVAQYDFSFDDHDTDIIELNDGFLLVELRPDSHRRLSVRTGSHTINVAGTVFSVETGDPAPRVAVFEGAVDVTDSEGKTHRLTAGEYSRGDERGQIDDVGYSHVERYIDLEEHRRLLRRASEQATRQGSSLVYAAFDAAVSETDATSLRQAPVEEGPDLSEAQPVHTERIEEEPTTPEPLTDDTDSLDGQEPIDAPVSPSATQLHDEALTALHEGRTYQAVDLLEEALQLAAPSDSAHGDILLELARIHLRQLDEPEMAADYLESFIAMWPDDPAAAAIRSQLCELDVDADCP